jgi:hypothetical protein
LRRKVFALFPILLASFPHLLASFRQQLSFEGKKAWYVNGRLTDADRKRLNRVGGRRGRNRPSKVPARLVRTSAFASK